MRKREAERLFRKIIKFNKWKMSYFDRRQVSAYINELRKRKYDEVKVSSYVKT